MGTKRQPITQEQNNKQIKEEILTGIIDNESKTYTFEAEVSIEGETKKGTFTAKYMGVAARLRIGTLRAKLLEGAPAPSLDGLTDDIAYMIAYLTVACTKTPIWWDYEKLDNVEDLQKVYMEVYKFVNSFREGNGTSTNVGNSENAVGEEIVAD